MASNNWLKLWLLLALGANGACTTTRTLKMEDLVQQGDRMLERSDQRPFTGQVIQLHSNEEPALAGAFLEGKKHGLWVQLWPNGKKEAVSTFRRGELHGSLAAWDEKGQPILEGAYKDGRKHGKWLAWYGNGKQQEVGGFREGKKHGTWAFYNKDGRVIRKEEFEDGKSLGMWTRAEEVQDALDDVAAPVKAPPPGSGEKVKVVMYVMSQCPYGVQAVDRFLPVLKEMGQHVDFRLEYIGEIKNGQPTSMHGDSEVKGDIHQLCAQALYPAQKAWTTFVACENRNWRALPAGWEKCAREAGLSEGKMRSCIDGSQGQALILASIRASQKANASGSPTIIIGGREFSGEREKLVFMRSVCAGLPKKTAACARIPPAPVEPAVEATIISDKRCPKCETRIKEIENIMVGRFFPKLKVTARLDWSTPAARALCKKLGIKTLPTMLFHEGVDKALKFKHLQRFLTKNGVYWQLGGIGVEHDPTAEICDNKKDDTGNGKVDCRDPSCKGVLLCRPERKRMVTVFVMSQCPFGVRAVNAMKEVLKNFGRRVKFKIHYIGDVTDGKPTSMHGQAEVDENIRQLCAARHYRKKNKYLDYIWCRFTGSDWRTNDWKKCAKNGISAKVIEKCFKGPGVKMLIKDYAVAKKLGFGASPTWLANNRHKFSGIAPEVIKAEICKHNKKLKNCDKTLSTSGAAVQGGCGN